MNPILMQLKSTSNMKALKPISFMKLAHHIWCNLKKKNKLILPKDIDYL